MWENAAALGAALVFAEHRFYGVSMPFGGTQVENMAPSKITYLTMEQALADFSVLIGALKDEWDSQSSAVVAFGGSYGGMLASWLRMKYPGSVDGAIAGSAPILAFERPESAGGTFGDGEGYWAIVTADATSAGGARPECASNVRLAWDRLFALAATGAKGREELVSAFRLCAPLTSDEDVRHLADYHAFAWDTLAMGNFPYPSNYLVFQQTQDPTLMLPAFPVRAACENMRGNFSERDDASVLAGLREASAVLYNASGRETCFSIPNDPAFDGIWDYQYCTEMLPQDTYFSRNGVDDMFWPAPMNLTAIYEHCEASFGVRPRRTWIWEEFKGTAGASNIVFSNGQYDPWRSGGVTASPANSSSVVAVVVKEGAHHLDLMFSNTKDSDSVKAVRSLEMEHVQRWIAEAGKRDATSLN